MKTKDPACGMIVDSKTARFSTKINRDTYYFCSKHCREKFVRKKTKTAKILPPILPRTPQGSPPIQKQKVSLQKKPNLLLKLKIIGMDNPHCVSTVNGALDNLPGIITKELLITEKAAITYDSALITPQQIKQAIIDVGYRPLEESTVASAAMADTEKLAREKEIAGLRRRTFLSLALSLPLVFISMIVPFFEITLPAVINNNQVIIQFLLATPVMFAGSIFFKQGLRAVFKAKTATMDTLVAVGVGTAYLYSLAVSIFILLGKEGYTSDSLYYEVGALLIMFILLGKYLEAVAKGKTSEAIKRLIGLQAKTALIRRNGREMEVPIEEVQVGDLVVVKPGQKIPVDGIIIEGHSAVDESMITGESIPAEKQAGGNVIGATLNKQGSFVFKATKVGSETMLAQIIKLVEEAQGSKAPIQKLADTISSYFVPFVVIIAVLSFFVWSFLGMGLSFALTTFVAVLIIACPCALGLATPTAIIVGTGKGAESGILFKNAEALQKAGSVDLLIFDKTGTLTKGKPEVTDIIPLDEQKIPAREVLLYAAVAEKRSEHPLGEAILRKAKEEKVAVADPQQFKAISGKGLEASYNKKAIILGNRRLMADKKIKTPANLEKTLQQLEDEGKTAMLLAIDKRMIGIIAVADTLKENSTEAIRQLQSLGKEVVMITGDNPRTAKAIGQQLGITQVLAEVLPEEKALQVKKFQNAGKTVAMVGDGINDAPALAQADVGIAIGSGTDVAIESGDIILIKDDLRDVVKAIELSKYTLQKIKQNLFWAFFYNSVGIPLAAGALYPFTGWLLSPIIAGAAMAFSSVSVVGNSLLMKRWKGL